MSKFLYLNMPLEHLIRATTSAPAAAMRLQDQFGMLQPGRQADIVLLQRERGSFPLTNAENQTRIALERIVPISVFKRGQWTACGVTS